ncbi:hypothetical protein [Marinomonas sp. THO17]|uniref:hypothetical protein n=1 Tax=Marinomonas sp. THO17 TaxID=3149048 RepID=UPI00336C0DF8
MTFALLYTVAVLSKQTCRFFASVDQVEIESRLQHKDDSTGTLDSLSEVLSSLDCSQIPSPKRILVLVPDAWLKVTQPILEHPVSERLLPLAALSYAVEVTFAIPEETHYAFYQEPLNSKQTRLTIYSCSQDWLKQLMAPFEEQGQSCILMSFTQYQQLKNKSWNACLRQKLSSFQPNFQRQQRARLYLSWGLSISLLLQCLAGGYYYYVYDAAQTTRLAYDQILDVQSTWLQDQQAGVFPLSALNLIQGLPKQVRIEQFYAYQQQANIQLKLPKSMVKLLLDNWQKRYPKWGWTFVQEVISQAPGQELVNAHIQIISNED